MDALKTLYCNGLDECLQALKDVEAGKLDIQYLEGMACQKGCLNGPGALTEPGLTRVLLKRFADTTQADSAGKIEQAMDGVKNVDMERVYLRK
nr:[Fe-Fe] hydrogenase large subunit C-terminal domain-containing protein [Acidaminococcus fermentans]